MVEKEVRPIKKLFNGDATFLLEGLKLDRRPGLADSTYRTSGSNQKE